MEPRLLEDPPACARGQLQRECTEVCRCSQSQPCCASFLVVSAAQFEIIHQNSELLNVTKVHVE